MDINNTRLAGTKNANPGPRISRLYKLLPKIYIQYLRNYETNYQPHPKKHPTILVDTYSQGSPKQTKEMFHLRILTLKVQQLRTDPHIHRCIRIYGYSHSYAMSQEQLIPSSLLVTKVHEPRTKLPYHRTGVTTYS